MSFVMITSASARTRGVRTVSLRALMLGGAATVAVVLGAGVALGYTLSRPVGAPPAPGMAANGAAAPFALEQLGALSARLFKLESQTGQLSERLNVPGGGPTRRSGTPAAEGHAKPAAGGPWLAPRPGARAEDGVDTLRLRLAVLERQIAEVCDAAAVQHLAVMRLPSRLPVAGASLVSGFGNRDDPITGQRAFHAGLDFSAPAGTAILAAAAGTVTFAGTKPDYGWVVEIDHGNGLTTRYAHASRLLVSLGSLVEPGDPIAAVGTTGRSTGPHLHFEVLHQGSATDPRPYLVGL